MKYDANVLDLICAEVDRQEAGPLAVPALVRALDYAWNRRVSRGQLLPLTIMHSDILTMAGFINCKEYSLYRRTPVVFRDGGASADWQSIPRLMDNVLNNLSLRNDTDFHLSLIKELLFIHPFEDGNGRLAFVVHNMFRDIGVTARDEFCYMLHPLPEFDFSRHAKS